MKYRFVTSEDIIPKKKINVHRKDYFEYEPKVSCIFDGQIGIIWLADPKILSDFEIKGVVYKRMTGEQLSYLTKDYCTNTDKDTYNGRYMIFNMYREGQGYKYYYDIYFIPIRLLKKIEIERCVKDFIFCCDGEPTSVNKMLADFKAYSNKISCYKI